MALESLVNKKEVFFLVITAVGCASGVTINDNHQGGNTSSTGEGGAAGFVSNGGAGGSEEVCFPNNSLICHNGDAYWQDSCGKLGQLEKDCSEKQVCDNGQCVYDCSMLTPVSGCTEQNCAFYDAFDYGTCKWNIKTGSPYTLNNKLHLEGNALIQAKNPPDPDGLFTLSSLCNSDFIMQYKAELLSNAQGSLSISHRNNNPNFSGITITHYPLAENNKIMFECNGNGLVLGETFDLHTEKTLKVHKIRNNLNLYVDNVLSASITCNGESTPVYKMIVAAGSAVLPQAMKVDDVTLYCQN